MISNSLSIDQIQYIESINSNILNIYALGIVKLWVMDFSSFNPNDKVQLVW